jgi:hypothetical protein
MNCQADLGISEGDEQRAAHLLIPPLRLIKPFAAECELMAKFTRSPENRTVWHRMAERWIRCAEMVERQYSLARAAGSMERHRKPKHSWVH